MSIHICESHCDKIRHDSWWIVQIHDDIFWKKIYFRSFSRCSVTLVILGDIRYHFIIFIFNMIKWCLSSVIIICIVHYVFILFINRHYFLVHKFGRAICYRLYKLSFCYNLHLLCKVWCLTICTVVKMDYDHLSIIVVLKCTYYYQWL